MDTANNTIEDVAVALDLFVGRAVETALSNWRHAQSLEDDSRQEQAAVDALSEAHSTLGQRAFFSCLNALGGQERTIAMIVERMHEAGHNNPIMTIEEWLDDNGGHETSPKILEAIAWLARGDADEARRIWEAPTTEQGIALWERVTKNGLLDSRKFAWGASGSRWANEYEACIRGSAQA